MARKPYKPDVEYIQKYYSYGSEAKIIEFRPKQEQKIHVPRPKRSPKTKIYVDPVALAGLAVALVMLVVMALGVVEFSAVCREHQQLREDLTALRDANVQLMHDYRTSYDLAEIEETARALGMIPVSEATTITVKVEVPQPQPEPTVWDDIVWFISGLLE